MDTSRITPVVHYMVDPIDLHHFRGRQQLGQGQLTEQAYDRDHFIIRRRRVVLEPRGQFMSVIQDLLRRANVRPYGLSYGRWLGRKCSYNSTTIWLTASTASRSGRGQIGRICSGEGQQRYWKPPSAWKLTTLCRRLTGGCHKIRR